MTLAKFGSRRLKTIVVRARKIEARDEQDGQRRRSSAARGGPVVGVP